MQVGDRLIVGTQPSIRAMRRSAIPKLLKVLTNLHQFRQHEQSLKAFMMLIGAGIIGICYALLNDFVLGTRFKQFWDAARVPQRNHHIVCGLGGIGVQIVQQSLQIG